MDRAVVYEAEDAGSNPARGGFFIKSASFFFLQQMNCSFGCVCSQVAQSVKRSLAKVYYSGRIETRLLHERLGIKKRWKKSAGVSWCILVSNLVLLVQVVKLADTLP